jgi:hypothetical protein
VLEPTYTFSALTCLAPSLHDRKPCASAQCACCCSQDKLGDNLQETWGNEPTIMEPDRQN